MPRYKPTDYAQTRLIPLSLPAQLQPGTLEYAIHYLLEERLDLTAFDQRFRNDATGRAAYNPRVLLKVILLGYARGLLSSRQLERACRENVVFMALASEQAPDHTTLATFISSIQEEVPALFTQVLLVCEQEGLLGGTHFSLDGVKLPSNAAKESSGTFADLRVKQQALQRKVQEALAEHRAADRADESPGDDDTTGGGEAGSPPPPRGPGARVARLQRQAERIEQFLATHEPKRGRSGREVQSNVTDNESGKLVSAHGVVQGYNANALVEGTHQVVVYAEAFGQGGDEEHVAPMLAGGERNLMAVGRGAPLAGQELSADTSYYSVENLEACERYRVDAYIP